MEENILNVPVNVSFTENQFNYVQANGTYTFTNTSTIIENPSNSYYYNPDDSDDGPIPDYIWAAIAIVVIVLCILVSGIIVIVYQAKSKKKRKPQNGNQKNLQYPEDTDELLIAGERSSMIKSETAHLDDPNFIPFEEITNLKQIEKGSFGVIFEANWRGTKIAVKKLPASMTDKLKNEFFQEATLMRSLRHPNILQYLGISQTGKEVCICMEFMPRGSLYRILHHANSSFSRSKIKAVCLDTARGMNYLHQQKPPIIHRDLKTHNLLVDRHWQVKVCDFGLSRITSQNQTMTACGTPSWTAPEVLRNERYTTKADIYGFGIVVWEMFARADPFPGEFYFLIYFSIL